MARDPVEYSSGDEAVDGMITGVKKVIINNDHAGNGEVSNGRLSPGEATPATSADADATSTVEDGPVEVGMLCDLKKLYSGKEDKKGRFVWQDTVPEDIGSPVENSETAKYALLVRNVKVYK
jgi:hypothetical protein